MTHPQVWFQFKMIEFIIGCVCIYTHMLGVFQKEPIPHNTYYCGTFVGWVMKTCHGMAGIYWNGRIPSDLMEAITCFVASMMHILAAYLGMNALERDGHLMYISNDSEASHPFFLACKNQTICALSVAFVYLLHGLLAADVIWAPPITDEETDVPRQGEDAIHLYVMGRYVHALLDEYEWFRRMGGEEYALNGPFRSSIGA